MKNAQIIAAIKNNEGTHEIEQAFQAADQQENFSFKFGKTQQHWNASNWNEVAKSVKGKL